MNHAGRFPSEPPTSEVDPLGPGLERPDDEQVFAFLRAMPAAYRRLFDEDAQHEHAAIVCRRGARACHIEIWRKLPERVVAVVVAADDRPGLLSRVSAALVAHDMDVIAAQAYGRTREDGAREAVDLVWIRRLPGPTGATPPIRSSDVAQIAATLEALVRGQSTFDGAVGLASARPRRARASASSATQTARRRSSWRPSTAPGFSSSCRACCTRRAFRSSAPTSRPKRATCSTAST
jgi:UTP:GlnB (protein PII) uridylyltransferase